jgi:hypothetical protein
MDLLHFSDKEGQNPLALRIHKGMRIVGIITSNFFSFHVGYLANQALD